MSQSVVLFDESEFRRTDQPDKSKIRSSRSSLDIDHIALNLETVFLVPEGDNEPDKATASAKDSAICKNQIYHLPIQFSYRFLTISTSQLIIYSRK